MPAYPNVTRLIRIFLGSLVVLIAAESIVLDHRIAPYDSRFTSFRTALNESIAALQAHRADVDREGRIFLLVMIVLIAALAFRLVCIAASPVPFVGTDAFAGLSLAAALVGASIAFARLNFVEAMLLARAGAMASCAQALMLPFCALAFYLGGRMDGQVSFADTWLAAADAGLGFDWPAYFYFVDQRPRLWSLLEAAYHSIFFQPQIVCVILALTRDAMRLYAMLTALVISLAVITGIAIFTPAIGPYLHFQLSDVQHPQDFPEDVAAAIRWLRAGVFDRAHELPPLITFPSFHACSAVIFTWGLWRTPVVRWAALTLNAAMLAATPIHGGHYLADVVAGGLIGLVTAIAVASALRAVGANEPVRVPRSWSQDGHPCTEPLGA